MSPPQIPPRSAPLSQVFAAAADVIAAVIGGRNLDRELATLPSPLRPAVQNLAYGTLRQFGRGDALLAPLLAKPLAELSIRALLLAAVYRLEASPDDAHTTVDQAVNAAATIAGGRFKSLVNAVLRNFDRQHTALTNAALVNDVARWQHPHWWIEKVRTAYPQQWQDVLNAGNGHPPMTLRLNRRRGGNAGDYLERLAQESIAARALDNDAILLDKPMPVAQLPGFASGDVSVQDWGAQRAAPLLDARSGMRVLDACAAPGGKTAHLLELADIDLTALDADNARLERVADNLRRLRLEAKLQVADAAAVDTWWDGKPFDRILADVPCSASGVVRRHPDAKWLRRKADVAGFARTQARIVDALWRTLVPGGKMLYCTCSLFAEENRQQINAFVARHPDAQRMPILTADGYQEQHGQRGLDKLPELQLIPTNEHDGFYYALLQKTA